MNLHKLLDETLPSGWSDAVDRARDEAEVNFRDTELASDWSQSARSEENDVHPSIDAAMQYAYTVVLAYLKAINGWAPNRDVMNRYLQEVVDSTVDDALKLASPYTHPKSKDVDTAFVDAVNFDYAAYDYAVEWFTRRLVSLLARDLIEFRRVAAKGRATRSAAGDAGRVEPSKAQPDSAAAVQHLTLPRHPRSVTNVAAAKEVEAYITKNAITRKVFAHLAGTTPKTLGRFLSTGTVKIALFDSILKAARLSKAQVLNSEDLN